MDQETLLDAAKDVSGSDYATAKRVGVTRQGISNARRFGTKLDLSTIGALAELCGKDPLRTIAAVAADREGQSKKGRNWRRWAGAAALFLGIGVGANVAAPSTTYASRMTSTDIHYVQRPKWLMPRTVKSILQNLRGFLCGVRQTFLIMFGCARARL